MRVQGDNRQLTPRASAENNGRGNPTKTSSYPPQNKTACIFEFETRSEDPASSRGLKKPTKTTMKTFEPTNADGPISCLTSAFVKSLEHSQRRDARLMISKLTNRSLGDLCPKVVKFLEQVGVKQRVVSRGNHDSARNLDRQAHDPCQCICYSPRTQGPSGYSRQVSEVLYEKYSFFTKFQEV